MSPITVVQEALDEGRALFASAGALRDLFKGARAEVDRLKAEAETTVGGLLSSLRAGLDGFKAEAAQAEDAPGADPAPAGATAADPAQPTSLAPAEAPSAPASFG